MQYTGLPSVGLKGTCVSFLQSAHVVGNISLSIDDMDFGVILWVLTVHMEIGTLNGIETTNLAFFRHKRQYFQNKKHVDNTVKFAVKNMNETKSKSDLIEKDNKSQMVKKIVCVKEENYLNELSLNFKRMQRMQDFMKSLE